ncbi:MAG: nucleoside:proton symporter [Desulfobacterales bacterium]|nr:nucleoside:proton symporter [Desulfobacterales bacterium]MBT7697289.1 nucleoside:proton symporter [Desulfobacterales bacterium]
MFLQGIAGLFVFIAAAWAISENKNAVHLKTIVTGVLIQFAVGAILIKVTMFRVIFLKLNRVILSIEESTSAGTSFVFGYLGGGEFPFDVTGPAHTFLLAFRALPLVLVMSALSALLFYWKILPLIVRCFSWALCKTMGIGGAEGLGVSANIFIGMVESPLLIRPYLKYMTRSEIFTLMTCGMATIAGTVMVLYASMLMNVIPDIMGHILTASIISVPAAITIAKVMIPETEELTSGELITSDEALNSMDAVTKGTIQGIQLLINIIGMLIVLVALIHLINIILGIFPDFRSQPVTLQRALGGIMAPVVWLMGIPWHEAPIAGELMGTKTVLNELIAYLNMSRLAEGTLSSKSLIIMTYALCGFANPGSLGIMIGGMGTMAPERRDEIVSLGLKSIIAGTIATCMTGAIVGILV